MQWDSLIRDKRQRSVKDLFLMTGSISWMIFARAAVRLVEP